MRCLKVGLVVVGLTFPVALYGQVEKDTIGPDQVSEHVDQEIVVEMDVRSTGRGKAKNGELIFLNSQQYYKHKTNFMVIIPGRVQTQFRSRGIKPTDHFLNKKIEVRGKVQKHRGKYEMVLQDAGQLKIISSTIDPIPKNLPFQKKRNSFPWIYLIIGGVVLAVLVGVLIWQLSSRGG